MLKTEEMQPPAPNKPISVGDFLKFLSTQHEKVRMDFALRHPPACDNKGVWTVKTTGSACLQVVPDAEQRRTKNFKLDCGPEWEGGFGGTEPFSGPTAISIRTPFKW